MPLFVVPTPIGNLEDITFRALRILKEVDYILAEDTRTSSVLLKNFDIQTPLYSFHAFNEHKKITGILNDLAADKKIALISDAGTPAISDPGFLLTRACVEKDIPFECLPGATALIPALVESGLPSDEFVFLGFLPVKKGRRTSLEKLSQIQRTMIFYESPHRLEKTLNQFLEYCGPERKISISREISKKFHETLRGTLFEILSNFAQITVKGEFVIVLQGKPY